MTLRVMKLLEIDNIDVYYGELLALKNINFKVEEGEFVSLIGGNGAGKSTLLNTIMGLLHPKSGRIDFQGESINRLEAYEIVKRKISLVPESKLIFPQMSVYENILMGAYPKECRANINKNLEYIYTIFPKLHERRKQMTGTLSGGEIQMVIISRALMSEPKLLLVDELSTGLSPKLTMESFQLLEKLHKEHNITILLAEQNMFEALRIADRGIVLENGQIVLTGEAHELLANDEVKERYLGI